MSVRIMTKVWDAAFPTMSMKLVALKLADCANDDGENVYPYVQSVEDATGASESTVREAIADMEASGLLAVTGSMKDPKRIGRVRPIRSFDVDTLDALHRKHGSLVWVRTEVPVHDVKTGEPKLDASGVAKIRQAWRLVANEVQPLGPVGSSHRPPGGPAKTALGSSHWTPPGPATGPPSAENPSIEPVPHPSIADAARRGVRVKDWIEELREEGHPPAVLDELLRRLVDGGLATWKGQDGERLDPAGPGRQVCLDLAADTVEVIEAVREAILSEAKYRFPPVARIREIAAEARRGVEQRLRERERQGDLATMPVLTEPSQRFMAELRRLASPDHVKAWFEPCGVVRVDGATLTIVTPHRPMLVAQFGDSFAKGAARRVWGAEADVEFVQGRALIARNAS